MKPHSAPIFGLVLILMTLSVGANAQGTNDESVLKAREEALMRSDFDSILTVFADDAIVVTSSGRLLIGTELWVKDQVDRHQREDTGPRQMPGNKLPGLGKYIGMTGKKWAFEPPFIAL